MNILNYDFKFIRASSVYIKSQYKQLNIRNKIIKTIDINKYDSNRQ